MADPDLSVVKVERYTVRANRWSKGQRRVKITLVRKDSWGQNVGKFQMSVKETRLLKALGDAGFHVHPDEETPR